tara:strand:- start:639 stop:2372 length:1734 start_codon:yes stop_codon:yes gene_type:complete
MNNLNHISTIELNNEPFSLPITFLNNKSKLKENVKSDLEMINCVNENETPVYEHVFKPTNNLGKETIKKWSEYYTTDKVFLKESQKLYKKLNNVDYNDKLIENMVVSREKLLNETNFYDKYQFIEWEKVKWLNNSSIFLYILSVYNITSPVLNLAAPLLILIFPFIILKLLKMPVTFKSYTNLLTKQVKQHAIGKLFYNFNSLSFNQKMYSIFCVGMYFYNLYQNALSCYRFYYNTHFIIEHMDLINEYFDYTLQNMISFSKQINKYKTYESFNIQLNNYIERIKHFNDIIKGLPKLTNKLSIFKDMGLLLKYFYTIYDNEEIDELFNYSFGFHGYVDTLLGLKYNIKQKNMNKIKYSDKTKFNLKNSYHPSIQDNPIKNNVDLSQNIILTGPNAAGKTTMIKSSIINLILSQQVGYGYYDGGEISLFEYIHCYINIPDSCSRDSLFQSEARRCKNILDDIENNPDKKHFCIFDELYSGTNPYEAIGAAYGYLKHISENKNVRFILTTHFIKLCDLLEKTKQIKNCNMKTNIDKDILEYKYKLDKGISKIKGGMSVLINLNYNNKIVKNAKHILNII